MLEQKTRIVLILFNVKMVNIFFYENGASYLNMTISGTYSLPKFKLYDKNLTAIASTLYNVELQVYKIILQREQVRLFSLKTRNL